MMAYMNVMLIYFINIICMSILWIIFLFWLYLHYIYAFLLIFIGIWKVLVELHRSFDKLTFGIFFFLGIVLHIHFIRHSNIGVGNKFWGNSKFVSEFNDYLQWSFKKFNGVSVVINLYLQMHLACFFKLKMDKVVYINVKIIHI